MINKPINTPKTPEIKIGKGTGLPEGLGKGSIKGITRSVESGDIVLSTNLQKGNYGEMKMDIYFQSKGYERISLDRVVDLNDSSHKGIDGAYYKADGHPPYAIGEAKYGSSGLSKTLDGKQ